MSFPHRRIPSAPTIPPPPAREERKPVECVKNLEIEKIKRQLYNLIDRVEQLKSK